MSSFPPSILLSLSLAAFLSSLGQYEIAIPVRTGPNGENQENPPHSRRTRRSTAEDIPPDSVLCFPTCPPPSFLAPYCVCPATYCQCGPIFFPISKLFYQLSTPQNKFLLNLTLQGDLLSRQFRVEYWKRGRLAWSRPYSSRCQYVGHLLDQPHSSKVALSNCNGLVRPTRPVSLTSHALTALTLPALKDIRGRS